MWTSRGRRPARGPPGWGTWAALRALSIRLADGGCAWFNPSMSAVTLDVLFLGDA